MATTTHSPRQLSRRRRFLFVLIIFFFIVVANLSIAEIILRKKGLTRWSDGQPSITWIPAERYHTGHPTLGYITRPGEFRFSFTRPSGYTFKSTHLSNGLRITHPLATYGGENKKEIWVFGCSITQGWTVNDEESYPWLLQEKFADYEVVNFGVDGYSTAQSLLQFREGLASGKRPALVILSYGNFHDQRNTLTRSWLKLRLTNGAGQAYGRVKLPYATLAKENKAEIFYKPMEYQLVPLLRHSALANYLDDQLNEELEETYNSVEVSQALIDDFSKTCKANGIEFVLAGIISTPQTAAMLERFSAQGIRAIDISADLNRPGFTNMPYDGHPSALAHEEYARKLEEFLPHIQTLQAGLQSRSR